MYDLGKSFIYSVIYKLANYKESFPYNVQLFSDNSL